MAAGAMAAAACGRDDIASPVAPTEARPALWRVADTDTTLYLFGTIHMLPPGVTWRSEAVDQALAASRAVYFEADVESDLAGIATLVERLGRLPPSQRLSDLLDTRQRSDLQIAAGRLGVAMQALDTMRPWLAAVTVADAAIRSAGFSQDGGAETVLRREARAAGKELRFLETVERQLTALANLPVATQVTYLDLTLTDLDKARDSLTAMADAWRSGDTDRLQKLLIDDDMARLPGLREALLARRNTEWADILDGLLASDTGVIFIAVGAAHLLGEDGLPTLMTARGHAMVRVQ